MSTAPRQAPLTLVVLTLLTLTLGTAATAQTQAYQGDAPIGDLDDSDFEATPPRSPANVSENDEMSPTPRSPDAKQPGAAAHAGVAAHKKPRLLISQLAMSAGGAINLSFERRIPKNKGMKAAGGTLALAPSLGLFIIDNLELTLALDIDVPFGDDFAGAINFRERATAFEVGASYLWDLGPLFLYAGGRVGFRRMEVRWKGYDTNNTGDCQVDSNGQAIEFLFNATYDFVTLGVPIGVLVPFNQYVALDAGMRLEVDLSLDENGFTYIRNPWGYFGLQGFFSFFD